MDVKLPEPVGQEVMLFERKIKKQKFTKSELENILNEIEQRIEEGINKLRDNIKQYSVVDYNLMFIAENNIIGLALMGGFCPEVAGELVNGSIERLREGYKKSFQMIKEEYKGQEIQSDMYLVAWRDSITKIIKARNPY